MLWAEMHSSLLPATAPEASHVLAKVMSDVIDLLEMDWSVVITHGNGPQVGHSSPWTRNKHTSLTLGSQQLRG